MHSDFSLNNNLYEKRSTCVLIFSVNFYENLNASKPSEHHQSSAGETVHRCSRVLFGSSLECFLTPNKLFVTDVRNPYEVFRPKQP